MFTKYYILWDLPEGIAKEDEPAHVLPLALNRSQYETQDEYERDVFERAADLGGYPVVGFMEYDKVDLEDAPEPEEKS